MRTFESKLVDAFDVGAFKLEDGAREKITVTPELHGEVIRLIGAVAEHGSSLDTGAKDLLMHSPEEAKLVLFTYKSHLYGGRTDQPTRYNEADLRFKQGLRVEGRALELVSIFHTEDLDLLGYPELVGGRHVGGWGHEVLGLPARVPDLPLGAPNYGSIGDAREDVEELCPATPEGMVTALSKYLRF